MQRYNKSLIGTVKKGNWSQEENDLLIALVNQYGTDNWELISRQIPGRSAGKCRERYKGYLDPSIKKGYELEQYMFYFLYEQKLDS